MLRFDESSRTSLTGLSALLRNAMSILTLIILPSSSKVETVRLTAVTDWLGIAFSTDWLSTDDLGQDVGERA
jgi:hypothetical protein